MVRVLFVCLGNICRSPMAEAVLRHKVIAADLENYFEIDSAGTASWHTGKEPHIGTRDKLDSLMISYDGMYARQVAPTDFQTFDYIIVMDEQNLQDVHATYKMEKEDLVVKKLLDYLPDHQEINVPDPYYTGNFDYTYELVDAACEQLLTEIRKKYQI